MEVNKASLTAIVSAFGRAYHSLNDEPKIFNDYLAEKMITDEEFKNISKNMIEGVKFLILKMKIYIRMKNLCLNGLYRHKYHQHL